MTAINEARVCAAFAPKNRRVRYAIAFPSIIGQCRPAGASQSLLGRAMDRLKLIGDCAGPITISVLTFLIAMPTIFPLYLAERLSGKHVPSASQHDQRCLWRWNNWFRSWWPVFWE